MKKAIFSLTLFTMAIGAFEARGHSIFKDGKAIYENVPQNLPLFWREQQPHELLDARVYRPPVKSRNKRLKNTISEIVISLREHYRSCVHRALEHAFEYPELSDLYDGQSGYDEQAVLSRCYYPTETDGHSYRFSNKQEKKWLSVLVHLNLPPFETLVTKPAPEITSMILEAALEHESLQKEAKEARRKAKNEYIATELEKLREAGLY